MTIEKAGNKWRITQMQDGIRYRVSVDHKPTQKEAARLIHEKIREAEPNICKKDSFEYHAGKYIEIKSNVISPSTKRGYLSILGNLSDTFKHTPTAGITQELIQIEINNYSASHSPKSVRNAHGFISAVLSVYRPNMKIHTTLPQKAKFEPNTPSESDIKLLLDEVAGTEYEIPIRLGCYGLRRGEVCAITAEDLEGNTLHINKSKVLNDKNEWVIKPFPKTTESQRSIYIDDYLADLIRKKGYAFADHPNRLNHHLHRLCKQLGITPFRYHDLRAYYCSLAHAIGIKDRYIMAHGGWSSGYIMNRVYKRAFEDSLTEADKEFAQRITQKI